MESSWFFFFFLFCFFLPFTRLGAVTQFLRLALRILFWGLSQKTTPLAAVLNLFSALEPNRVGTRKRILITHGRFATARLLCVPSFPSNERSS